MATLQLTLRLKGGPGSGHRGHAGRPGSVGGSVPGAIQNVTPKVLGAMTRGKF